MGAKREDFKPKGEWHGVTMPGRLTVPPQESGVRQAASWHGKTVPTGTTVPHLIPTVPSL